MYRDYKNRQSVSSYINNEEYDEEEIFQGESFDDFEFNTIPANLQARAEELYMSEASMNDMYDAFVTYENLGRLNGNHIPILNGEWAFPESGTYKGIIIECERSKKNSFEFILKLLINGRDVRFIKFSPSQMSRVYRCISNMISKHDDYFDTTALIGRVAIATIRNQRSHSGFIFSNVDHFEVLSEIDEEIVIEMLKVMLKVYDENHE